MTREEELWSMTAKTLQVVGLKLGLDIKNSDIKKGKATIIEKIIAVEADQTETKVESKKIKTQHDFLNAVSDILDGKAAVEAPNKSIEVTKASETEETMDKPVKAPKKANLKLSELTYKGETKSIKEWAVEINMPWPTLYDRINRNGWPVDLAIETPLGQRRPKQTK